ncbi:NAD-dependent succinate-semialdehyde dehydrogenase [Pseudohongiella spirulinae]|uniref:Succinate-semialdehyde dehydrogenase n=1 Tax=Pseudohongiella spirulinae TaxID=1249552 RepID=A0A0S2KBJ4_9GAMM|nr:NAD-dependent succinate-semialdehyde dehydrogenase [Pseudohongiella spirulinae]ALO45658.1 Succinate-semialdehyde dehydrogenase [Pseudohongiella spirulinae]
MSEVSSINPYTGKTIKTWPAFDLKLLDATLHSCDLAQQRWRQTSLSQRAALLHKLAQVLSERSDELASLACQEMGKTRPSAKAEVEKCAWVCEYYAEHGEQMLADQAVDSDDGNTRLVCFQPLGLVLAIMPWNFPFWQVFRFLAPALMAGNGAILKHASNVPGCALAIESVCQQAGVPDDLFRTLLVSGKQANVLIEHPLIKAVTFTGSTDAGRKIASVAGGQLKKTVLELGGSDPYLILDDADVALAAEKCVTSRLLNNGQSCIAAKRFIVHDSLYGEFAAAMTAAMAKKVVGDPMLEGTDIGPQARPDLCDELAAQVEESIRLGAVLVTGGRREGSTYWPTVLGEVRPGMPAFDQELFGPVAALIRARNEQEAIELANASMFGLGAAVFTRDTERGHRVALALEAGACAVNDFVKSEPGMPFGGVKASGYGRELAEFGIREFTNIKSLLLSP